MRDGNEGYRGRAEAQLLGPTESLARLTASHRELRATGLEEKADTVLEVASPHSPPLRGPPCQSGSGKPLRELLRSVLAENVSQYNLQNFRWKCISR